MKRKFPKLYKLLARTFGARKAIAMLNSVKFIQEGCVFQDSNSPTGCFSFGETVQGFKYWALVTGKVKRATKMPDHWSIPSYGHTSKVKEKIAKRTRQT
jgi:hypothetical protein